MRTPVLLAAALSGPVLITAPLLAQDGPADPSDAQSTAPEETAVEADSPDLERRVAELEALTAELRAAVDSEKTATVEQFARIEELIGATTQSGQVGAPISGFRVGDTVLRIGGYVDFDGHLTYYSDGPLPGDSAARDFYVPGATPIGGDSKLATDLTAQSTRFSVTATREIGGALATAYLETDFLLTEQGDERVSSSFSERLRRAFVDYAGWRVGQEWSTFQDLSAIPESASFLVLPDGMAFDRQALVRYTTGAWAFALENASTTLTDTDGSRATADASVFPNLVVRRDFEGDFGNVSLPRSAASCAPRPSTPARTSSTTTASAGGSRFRGASTSASATTSASPCSAARASVATRV